MTAERWELMKRLLHQAMQLAPAQRAPFLDKACSSDQSLRAEVNSLLLADEQVRTSFLQTAPAAGNESAMTVELPRVPTQLGPYEILEALGKGGMGEVYRARDTRLRRYVAIKILPAAMCGDPDRVARFEHEARAASALNHPHIVAIHDIGREGGIPFIVTEFIAGESLRRILTRGPIPPATLVEVAIQMVSGLEAAHASGIVHRDLKPENIMLTRDMQVKILDFGLAKHIKRMGSAKSGETRILTAPGVVVGTIGYLSPEQVRGGTVDERSDIFTLGAVLYEMAGGKRAFRGDKVVDVINAVLEDEPEKLLAKIPNALDRIIRRCLEKDPQKRFQNATQLSNALKSIGEILRVQQVLFSRERRRHSPWLAAAVPAVVLIGAGAWFVPHWLNGRGGQPAALPVAEPAHSVPRNASLDHEAKETTPTEPAAALGKTGPGASPPRAAEPGQPAPSPPAVIEAFAGQPWKFSGDGMPARQVALGHCDDVRCDLEGNIYTTDWGNQAIVKIDRSEILHVLAGPDSPPDSRPASPHFLALDASRAIYFSQVFIIRKLLPTGRIVPFAGKPTPAILQPFTADGSLAQGAALAQITGIVQADDGSIMFSEFNNHRVRRVDPQGRLQTLAGNGTHGFSGDGGPAAQASLAGPRGLALDRAGNLFVADTQNSCVRKVSPTGQIETVAGHGIGGILGCPTGLAVNSRNELFVADPCKGNVVVVRGGKISLVAGRGIVHDDEPSGIGGPAIAASFDLWGLALDEQENLLVSGPDFGHIYRISHDGTFTIVAGSGQWGVTRDGTPARQALFQSPLRLAADGQGNIYMADRQANRIYRIDRKGTVTLVAGYSGLSHGGFEGPDTAARFYSVSSPHGIRVRADGSVVFADSGNHRVREVSGGLLRTLAGNGVRSYGGDGGRAVDAGLNDPQGVCLDSAGNVYIADTGNHRIRKVTPDGRILTVAGIGAPAYSGDGGPADRAALNTPTAVETDPNGDLYIADMQNHCVRRVSSGVITTLAADALELPADLALAADRQLFILDTQTRRIRVVDLASGTITTFAGNGESTSSGDGGPAMQASLGRPGGIAVDPAGDVYVTDQDSRQVRVIRRALNRR